MIELRWLSKIINGQRDHRETVLQYRERPTGCVDSDIEPEWVDIPVVVEEPKTQIAPGDV